MHFSGVLLELPAKALTSLWFKKGFLKEGSWKKIHLQHSNSNWYKLQTDCTEGCWVTHFSSLKQCTSKATLHLILEDSLINLNAEALQKQKTCYATFGFTEPSTSIIFTSFSMFPLCLILLLAWGCRCLCLFPTAKTVLSYNVMATI